MENSSLLRSLTSEACHPERRRRRRWRLRLVLDCSRLFPHLSEGFVERKVFKYCLKRYIDLVQALAALSSPYITRYYGSFVENEALHIVMEYAENGNLYDFLKVYKDDGYGIIL